MVTTVPTSAHQCYRYSCAEFSNLDNEQETFSPLASISSPTLCSDDVITGSIAECNAGTSHCGYLELEFSLRGAPEQRGRVKLASCVPEEFQTAVGYMEHAVGMCEGLKEEVEGSGGVPDAGECRHIFCGEKLCNGDMRREAKLLVARGKPRHTEL